MKPENTKKKVIVVGAGISGLVAGIYALKAGFEAEIYESHKVAGGECTGWQRNGYMIDGCIHWLTGTKKGTDLYRIWKTCHALGEDVAVLNNDYITAYQHEGKTYYFYVDLKKLEQELLNISPEDESEIKQLIEIIRDCQELPIPALKPNELLSEEERNNLFAGYMKAGKHLEMGNSMIVREYTERFRSPVIRKMISTVVPEHIALTSLFFTLGTRTSSPGSWPEGGSKVFTQRMKQRFEEMGGAIYLNSPVKNIAIENGKAIGVTLRENNELKRADYIIPATDAHLLLDQFLEGKYKDNFFDYRFNQPESYPLLSATIVSLGVDIDIKDRPHDLCIQAAKPVSVNKSIHSQIVIRHFGFDTGFNPQGKSTIQVLLDDAEYDYWSTLKNTSEDDYRAEKERIANEVIAEIEQVYPEIKGHIKMVDVATPLTTNRYCGAYKGAYMAFVAIPGVKQENHQGYIEGIENMYLAGQWVFPDGGLPMAAIAGKFAVQRICHKEQIEIVS
ncbi:MAG: NAD(P)/FAD-dependent oxidoreductase [Bacteroidales bacterium]|jgi:phytoene dehydrogenase-like protein|nr:NAD(P)/FAD-dependent oxidoreductase [Bacteroidales bacterium]